ncbi:MAG: hypothetical protein BMS9Abin06_0204 [Gammaproteobacteria bacterium]|nr:MAG: hypothetical protein BMS9Abin06_0204 [Gammaproteobacteria bacterium]
MFGIGFPEMILILVLVVLVVGPERLPDVVRKGASFLREARNQLSDIKTAVNQQTESLREPLESIQDSIKQNAPDVDEKVTQSSGKHKGEKH